MRKLLTITITLLLTLHAATAAYDAAEVDAAFTTLQEVRAELDATLETVDSLKTDLAIAKTTTDGLEIVLAETRASLANANARIDELEVTAQYADFFTALDTALAVAMTPDPDTGLVPFKVYATSRAEYHSRGVWHSVAMEDFARRQGDTSATAYGEAIAFHKGAADAWARLSAPDYDVTLETLMTHGRIVLFEVWRAYYTNETRVDGMMKPAWIAFGPVDDPRPVPVPPTE